MGISLFGNSYKSSNSCESANCDSTPNPNPFSFKIISIEKGDDFDLIRVKYPHCTTFNGEKFLVVKKDSVNFATTKLDPHFLEDGNIIARFQPNESGLKLARMII